jgi:hypothetical protein
LSAKLHRLAKALRRWHKTRIGDTKLQLLMAEDLIFQLDRAQEERPLDGDERELRRLLKSRVLGLAVIERIKMRQRSRVCWLRAGDANTRFFHLKANGRRRKNFIHTLLHADGAATEQRHKQQVAHTHFSSLFGAASSERLELNWEELGLPVADLSDLDAPFSEEEVLAALLQIPSDKAPGPDGFNALFFKACWPIIKGDVLLAFQQLHNANRSSLSCINSSHIVLIPKTDSPASLADYRPISLMHGVAKLFMKVLAVRLAKRIDELIAEGQSAFIRGRSIQDNFIYVQGVIRHFHRARNPLVFLKLDIARAFDSVSWPYLLDMLRARGFSDRWRDLISMMLATSSSRVILNGEVGPRFLHRRGLRQGDPLSPLLFLLAIEPLHRLFDIATVAGLLSPLRGRKARLR